MSSYNVDMRAVILALPLLLAAWPTSAADPVAIVAAARSLQPGELVVLTLTTTRPTDSLRVRAFGRDIPAFRVGSLTWRVLIGIDVDVAPGTYQVAIQARPDIDTTHSLIVRSKRFPTRVLRVDDAFVNPPTDVRDRIARETNDLARLWSQSAAERAWTGPFVPPVPDPVVSQFGTRSIFNGQRRNPHGGVDFLSMTGTPVKAPGAGRIVLARDLYFSGDTVVIDHGLGLFSLLAHLSAIDTHEGDTVSAGQRVGRVGATGRVTGPHLHWAVRVGDARVDPLSVLAVLGPTASDQTR
jgi:murein DD-endopeptidase MepM/ murein hydrolase activator NlpD